MHNSNTCPSTHDRVPNASDKLEETSGVCHQHRNSRKPQWNRPARAPSVSSARAKLRASRRVRHLPSTFFLPTELLYCEQSLSSPCLLAYIRTRFRQTPYTAQHFRACPTAYDGHTSGVALEDLQERRATQRRASKRKTRYRTWGLPRPSVRRDHLEVVAGGDPAHLQHPRHATHPIHATQHAALAFALAPLLSHGDVIGPPSLRHVGSTPRSRGVGHRAGYKSTKMTILVFTLHALRVDYGLILLWVKGKKKHHSRAREDRGH